MSAYLDIAHAVLSEAKRPLDCRTILAAAYHLKLVPDDLYGQTQHKTVQARLSADILKNKFESRFARTEPGRFILRQDLLLQGLQEHFAPTRLNQLRSFQALCVPKSALRKFALARKSPDSFDWREVGAEYKFLNETDLDEWQVVRLVMTLKKRGKLATRRTFSSYGHDPYGTLGFTIVGYLKPEDLSLFDKSEIGLRGAVGRELYDHAYLQGRELSAVIEGVDFSQAFVLSPKDKALKDHYLGIVVTADLGVVEDEPWSLDVDMSPERLNDPSKLEPWSRELASIDFAEG